MRANWLIVLVFVASGALAAGTQIESLLVIEPGAGNPRNSEGDIVELVAGPFKGEKARVMKIDETKEEITVELFEAMVRIPVTVRGDSVRVLQKEEEK